MSDPFTIDDLAREVAAYLDALEYELLKVAVKFTENIATVETETDEGAVHICPIEASDETFNQGGDDARTTWTLGVATNLKLRVLTRQQAFALADFYKLALRGTNFAGWQFEATNTRTLFDFGAQKTKNRFLQLFTVSFWNIT
jgi:hypothetical protein